MGTNESISLGRSFISFDYSQALVEAERCLGCYDAPCVRACPAHVNVPNFIRRFREENLEGASELIYEACPLGSICGTACPTQSLCEGACVLKTLGQYPIRIGALQAYITMNSSNVERAVTLQRRQKIAIIGGGPAGLGCAVQLLRLGYRPHVFEKRNTIGGLVDQVIPVHRLPNEVITHDIQRLSGSGIQFHLGNEITSENVQELVNTYDAVFVGIGLSNSNFIKDLASNVSGVINATDFLEISKHSEKMQVIEKKVIVVGAGNVALDAAVVAKKLGAKSVTLLYRRSKDEMPGWESEYIEAATLGIEFRWMSAIKESKTKNNEIKCIIVQGMMFEYKNSEGRRKVTIDPNCKPYEIDCDLLVIAYGQSLDRNLPDALNLPISENGTIQLEDSIRLGKVFAAGEAVSGGGTIIKSLTQGLVAGRCIHAWLESEKNDAR
jgi:glutamate synthase (NADPH/NADH) small chain